MMTHMDPETSWASIDNNINNSAESLLLLQRQNSKTFSTSIVTAKLQQQRPANCYIHINYHQSSTINHRRNLRKNAILLLIYCCFFCITYVSAIVATANGTQLQSPSLQQSRQTDAVTATTAAAIVPVHSDAVMLKNIQENVQLADEEDYFEEDELDEYQLLIANKSGRSILILKNHFGCIVELVEVEPRNSCENDRGIPIECR